MALRICGWRPGVDIAVVSRILGHSQIGITADTYSHLLEGVGRAAAEAATAMVPRAPRALPAETAGLPSGSHLAPRETDWFAADSPLTWVNAVRLSMIS